MHNTASNLLKLMQCLVLLCYERRQQQLQPERLDLNDVVGGIADLLRQTLPSNIEVRFDLADGGESHFAEGLWVSGSFFRVLGVPALRGRIFNGDEDRREMV